MQFEVKVSPFDLKGILVGLVGTDAKVDMQLLDGERIESCRILKHDDDSDMLFITSTETGYALKLSRIKSVEFEGFHKYKSVSAKIFVLE